MARVVFSRQTTATTEGSGGQGSRPRTRSKSTLPKSLPKSRLLGAASALALVAVLSTAPTRSAYADCEVAGSGAPTTGDDIILCDDQPTSAQSTLEALAGNDTITLAGADIAGSIDAGDDDDVIDLLSGTVADDVLGGAGDDRISLNGALVSGDIVAGAGNDTVELLSGTNPGRVFGGDGDDILLLSGAIINRVNGEDGDDQITLLAGDLGEAVGGAGNDTLTLNGATLALNGVTGGDGDDIIRLIAGNPSTASGGAGDDTIVLTGADLNTIFSGDDDDVINLLSGTVVSNVSAGDGKDTILLNGAAISGDLRGEDGNDRIDLIAGSASAVLGAAGEDTIVVSGSAVIDGNIDGGDDDDTIVLTSADLGGNVLGGAGNDVFELRGNVGLSGTIKGGLGNDALIVFSGAVQSDVDGADGGDGNDTLTFDTFSGTVTGLGTWESLGVQNGSTATADGVTVDDVSVEDSFIELIGATVSGNVASTDAGVTNQETIVIGGGTTVGGSVLAGLADDTVTMNGGLVSGDIVAGAGNDTVKLLSGRVLNNVLGGDGNDALVLDGARARSIRGEEGDDTISLLSGTVSDVFGSAGNDTITLNGVDGVNGVSGGDDDDVIRLIAGDINEAVGNFGNDTIVLTGADIDRIEGGDDDDIIDLLSGTVQSFVTGSGGDDTIVLNGASVTGNLLGGDGNDHIDLIAGLAEEVIADAGDDTIRLAGALISGSIDGGNDADIIELVSGTVGAAVRGGGGADTITLSGTAAIANEIEGGEGDDSILLIAASSLTGVSGGEGNDTISLAGALTTNIILGGDGNDAIDLLSGTVSEQVFGGDGDDVITLNGAAVFATNPGPGAPSINGEILGEGGDDRIVLLAGKVGLNVSGEDGDDTIVVSGSASVGEDIQGGTGNDRIVLTGADLIGGDIEGNTGNDVFELRGDIGLSGTIQGGFGDDTLVVFSGAVQADVDGSDGGDGTDTLTFDAFSGTVASLGAWETLGVRNGSKATLDGLAVDGVSVEDSFIELIGATVSGNVASTDAGVTNEETIVLGSGTIVGGSVLAGLANDTITMNGASVGDAIDAGDGEDTIDLLSGTVAELVAGGAGNDTITLDGAAIFSTRPVNGGTATMGDIDAGDGDDIILLTSGTVGATVVGGAGDDTITQTGASVGEFIGGGDGEDLITITGGTARFVNGGNENDVVVLEGGQVFFVQDGGGDDTLILNGATITGGISFGGGEDVISLLSGTVSGSAFGGNDTDTLTLNGASVGSIAGGAGGDIISLIDGTVAGRVEGDALNAAGNDTFNVNGTAVVGSNIDGEDGDDLIVLSAATSIGGNVLGGRGNDVFELRGDVGLSGTVQGGLGNDQVIVFSGAVQSDIDGADGGGGTDSLTFDAFSGTVTGIGGFEILGVQNGSDVVADGASADAVSVEDSRIELIGATIGGGVASTDNGITNEETIVLGSGTTIGGRVVAGLADDTITLNGAVVSGIGRIGIDSGSGNDVVSLLAGTTRSVETGDGDDIVTLNGATVLREPIIDPNLATIDAGAGNDTILIVSGAFEQSSAGGGRLVAGAGDDIITVSGTVSGLRTLSAGDGADTIHLISGNMPELSVVGNGGNDTYVLSGATVGLITAGGGNDTVLLESGTINGVRATSPTTVLVRLNGATITGTINNGVGDAVIELLDGTLTGGISSTGQNNAGTRTVNDTIIVSGTVFVGGDLEGGKGDDIIVLTAATAIQANILGDAGNDLIELRGDVGLTGTIQGGLGDDTLIVFSGAVQSDVDGADGGGDTDTLTFDGFSGTVTSDGAFEVLSARNGGKLSADGLTVNEVLVENSFVELVGTAVRGDVTAADPVSTSSETVILGAGTTIGSTASGGTLFNGLVTLGNGADTVILSGANLGAIQTGDGSGVENDGADLIELRSGTVTSVRAIGGDDVIRLSGAFVISQIRADDGDDLIELTSGTVGGGGGSDVVFGDDGDDTIILSGAFVDAAIRGRVGNDTILLLDGTVTGDVGDQEFNNDGAILTNTDDLIVLSGTAAILGDIDASFGDDTIVLTAAKEFAGSAFGGGGNDLITLNGAPVSGDIDGGDGNDTIMLASGTMPNAGSEVRGGAGNDTITLNGAVLGADIIGDDGDDVIDLLSGSLTLSTDMVLGGLGNDTITLAGASTDGDIRGNEGNDLITLNSGTVGSALGDENDDTIVFNGATVQGNIDGGDDDDVILLNAGTMSGDAVGGAGNDTITLNGATISDGDIIGRGGEIRGGLGNDLIVLNSGLADITRGGDGDDTIIQNGADGGNLQGNAGNDLFLLFSGSGFGVEGGGGDDTYILNGTVDADSFFSSTGNDTFQLIQGRVGRVSAGSDDDLVVLTGATVDGSIFAGFGNDVVRLLSGTVTGDVSGEDTGNAITVSDDTITVSGTAFIGGTIDGGIDDDTIVLTAASLIGGDVLGGDGDDVIELRGNVGLSGTIQGGLGDDNLIVFSGAVAADVSASDGGDGTDTLTFDAFSGTIGALGSWESLGVRNGSMVTADGVSADDVSVEDSFIELISATVVGNVASTDDGDTNQETIILGSGTTIGGSVLAGLANDTITLNGATVEADINGGGGNDVITLAAGNLPNTTDSKVLGGTGDDLILLDGALMNADIFSEDGNDTVILASGSVDFVDTGEGDDTLILNGLVDIGVTAATRTGNDTVLLLSGQIDIATTAEGNDLIVLDGATVRLARSGDGDDTILLNSGFATNTASAGSGNDLVVLNGATVSGLFNDDGADTIDLFAGTLTNGIRDDENALAIAQFDDVITVSGTAFVGGNIEGGAGNDTVVLVAAKAVDGLILGGAGNDVFELRGDVGLSGSIQGGLGDDELIIFSGAVQSDVDAADGGDGNDTLTFDAFSGTITTPGSWESLGVQNGSTVTATGIGVQDVGVEDSFIELISATISGDVVGTDGGVTNEETIILGAGTTIGGSVLAGLANDSITLNGATIDGLIEGGDGDDLITFVSGSVGGGISGGRGDDELVLFSNTFGTDLTMATGGEGTDTLTFDQFAGIVEGVGDWEILSVRNNSRAQVDGLTLESIRVEDSRLDLFGTTITGDVVATDGGISNEEIITLSAGTIIGGDVRAGMGNDQIQLRGPIDLGGTILGGDGDDELIVFGGASQSTVMAADGGNGNDTLVFNNFTGTLTGGDINTANWENLGVQDESMVTITRLTILDVTVEDSQIELVDATVTGNVLATDRGFSNNEIIILGSGANVGGSVLAGQGNDVITVNGALIEGDVDVGDGNDTIVLLSAAGIGGDIRTNGPGDRVEIKGALGLNGIFDLGSNGEVVVYDGADGADLTGARAINAKMIFESFSGTVSDIEGFNVRALNGSDVTVDGAVLAASVTVDNSRIELIDVDAFGSGLTGTDNDEVVVLGPGTVIGREVATGGGDDTITLNGAMISGEVFVSGGDLPTGTIEAGAGDDLIELLSGTVRVLVDGGAGNDTIRLDGATVAGTSTFTGVTTDIGEVLGGDGNDLIEFAGGTVGVGISGGEGDDELVLFSGTFFTDLTKATGDGGTDVLTLDNFTGQVFEIGEWEILGVRNQSDAETGGTSAGPFMLEGVRVEDSTIRLIDTEITGDVVGTDGGVTNQEVIVLGSGTTVGGDVRAGLGDDTVILDGATVSGDIDAGAGNDTIDLIAGAVAFVFGGDDDDLITLDGGSASFVFAGSGNDTVLLMSGVADTVDSGSGNGRIVLDGAEVGTISAGGGDDVIILTAGTVVGVRDGNGDDTVTLNGAFVTGDILSSSGFDTINLLAGTLTGSLFENTDPNTTTSLSDDVVVVSGTVTVGGDIVTDAGEDTIVLTGAQQIGGDVDAGAGNDWIELRGDIGLGGAILGGEGDDALIVFSGAMQSDIDGADGGIGNDTLAFDAFSGTISALGSWESLGVQNGSTVTAQGVSAIDVAVEDSFIELIGATISGDVVGTDGGITNEEVIVLESGTTVGGNVLTRLGDDTITLNGAIVGSDINAGTGNDTINLFSGSATLADGQSGNDKITLAGAVIGGVFGDDGTDTIDLLSGRANVIDGGNAGDAITLAGAEVGGILGGGGDDVIDLLSGTVEIIASGGVGNDTITLNGAIISMQVLDDPPSFAGEISGEAGDDVIALISGTVSVIVLGESGNDTITLVDASVGDIDGGQGSDLILIGGTGVVNGDVFGGADDDTILLNAAGGISGDVVGGAGSDLIELRGGVTVSGSIDGGDDDDELVLFSGAFGIDLTSVTGGDGVDILTFDNFSGTIGEAGDWETVGLRNQSDATLDGLTDVERVRVEDSRVELIDTAIIGDIVATDGGADNQEDVILSAGTTVGGGISLGLGNDMLKLRTGFDPSDVTGTVDGGVGGSDSVLFAGITGTAVGEALVNWEIVDLAAQTDLTLAGDRLVTGDSAGQGVFVRDGSILRFANDFVIDGDLANFGTVDLGADGEAGTDLTVTGDYTAGSDLFLDVFVGSDGSVAADTLTIEGTATGDTQVTLTLLEDGEAGDDNSVLLISVAEPSDGTFELSNTLISGLFELELVSEDSQNWFLESSETFIGQSFAYESLPGALQTVGSAAIGTLAERVGVAGAVAGIDGPALALPMSSGVWGRLVGVSADSEGDLGSATGGSFEQTVGLLQAGAEFVVSDSADGRLLIGGMAHIGQSSLDAFDRFGAQRGDIDIDAYGGGLNVTWYGTGGFYADGVVQYTAYDIDLNTTGGGRVASTDGWGVAISGEAGYRLPIGGNFAIVPQAQLVWQTVDFDDFTDRDGIGVSLDDGDSLVGRLGVAVEGAQLFGSALVTGYAEANLLHEFLGDNQVTAADTTLTQDFGGTSAEVGVGGTLAVSDSVSIYAEIDYRIPFDDGVEAIQASGGLRVNW